MLVSYLTGVSLGVGIAGLSLVAISVLGSVRVLPDM